MERPGTPFILRLSKGRLSKRLLLIAVPAALLAFAAVAVFSAQKALQRARRIEASAGRQAFTLRTLDPAAVPGLRFEPVAAASRYTAGAFFAGQLYLAGPAGLTIFGPDGAPKRTLRTGVELPVAQITAIAQGRLRGSSEPWLLLGTDGAGVLMLEAHGDAAPGLRQLLPAAAGAASVSALLPLATGDLLLGTPHDGVLRYDGRALTRVPLSLDGIDPAKLQVTALAAVDAESYLLGTRNAGVFYSHAGTFEHLDSANGLPDDQVEALAVRDDRAYAGTPLGTAEIDLTSNHPSVTRIVAKGLFSHALAVTDDTLAVGTLDQGMRQVSLASGARLTPASIMIGGAGPSETSRIDAFLSVPNALYALVDGTLQRRSGGGWVSALSGTESPETLADHNISALAFAPDGDLYIGFFDRGLDILPSEPGSAIRHLEDDHLFCINRLALDPERHTMAAATANGLVLFDQQGTPRQTLTRREGLISDHVTDVVFTPGGTALATPAGLTFLTPHGAESLYGFQGLVNNHVYALAAKQDRLLAGTLGGLSVLEREAVRRNLTVNNSGLKHNWITALLPTSTGYLVGTYGAGVETLDEHDQLSPIELPAGTPRDLVINPNALFATATHTFAGTLGYGFLVYTSATGRWAVVDSGLPSLNVTAFAVRDGQLYIGTEDGLVRVAEADLP